MVLYVALPENRHTVHFFTSPNLRQWTLASITEGIAGTRYLYECPDFFELPVDGPRLTFTPVKELESLRTRTHQVPATALEPGRPNPLAGVAADLVELRAEFEPGDTGEVVFGVRAATLVYDAKQQELVVNGHRASAPLRGGRQRLIIYCDRTGLEVFASDGLTYVPMPFQPNVDNRSLTVSAKGEVVRFTALDVYELGSAWK